MGPRLSTSDATGELRSHSSLVRPGNVVKITIFDKVFIGGFHIL